jgi:hypothetical protein
MEEVQNYRTEQKAISDYLENFRMRSDGFDLGRVVYSDFISGNNSPELKRAETFFFSIPIKNQEINIVSIIDSLIENADVPISIGLLFDNCEDSSEKVIRDFFMNYDLEQSQIMGIHIVKSDKDLFESTCENILALFCKEKYFVSLQADCYLNEKTFLRRCMKAFAKSPQLMGISGRAVVPFLPIPRWKEIFDSISRKLLKIIRHPARNLRILGWTKISTGYFGDTSNYPQSKMTFSRKQLNTVYLGQAIIRGPIVWDFAKFLLLNKFDDVSFFLGRDDCDLCIRGAMKGYEVGFIPSFSYSISGEGTTRKPRSQAAIKALEERAELASKFEGVLGRHWKNASQKKLEGKEVITRSSMKIKKVSLA